jgi:hypothetical protein
MKDKVDKVAKEGRFVIIDGIKTLILDEKVNLHYFKSKTKRKAGRKPKYFVAKRFKNLS